MVTASPATTSEFGPQKPVAAGDVFQKTGAFCLIIALATSNFLRTDNNNKSSIEINMLMYGDCNHYNYDFLKDLIVENLFLYLVALKVVVHIDARHCE